ncbi:MAG: hypothetical protein LBH29_00700 [Elusimicrobiota bacterium]|nr:hypothetical protein [Elusimicrobiota bacterium]
MKVKSEKLKIKENGSIKKAKAGGMASISATSPRVSLRRKPQSIFVIRRSLLSAVFFKGNGNGNGKDNRDSRFRGNDALGLGFDATDGVIASGANT